MRQAKTMIAPAKADVAGRRSIARRSALRVAAREQVELGGHPLLDAVDDAQLLGAGVAPAPSVPSTSLRARSTVDACAERSRNRASAAAA